MATTTVDIIVKTLGTSKLVTLDNSLKKIPGTANKAAVGVDKVSKAVRGLGSAIATLGAADQLRRAFGAAADFSGTEQRVSSLVKRYQQLEGIQGLAAQSAKKFAVSNAQALSDLTDLGSRLGSSGVTLKEIENIYGGFNTLLVNNAVSAQQAASAQLQLNQALGSGRLAGEEFNAINEATPQLLDEVAEVLKVSRGELKQLAADGEISSAVLIQALTNVKTKGAAQLSESFTTPAGKLREFNAAISDFQVAIGTELLPVITPLVAELTNLLKGFSDLPEPVKTAAVGITAAAVAVGLLNSALALLTGTGIAGIFTSLGSAAGAAALKLAILGGGAKTTAVAFTAAGAAVTKTTVAINLQTVAAGALKLALLAIPWVAAAAAIGYVAKGAFDANQKIRTLEESLRDTTGTGEALKQKMNETAAEIKRLKGTLDKAGPSADYVRKKIELLTAALNEMKGRYDIEIVLSTFGVDVGSLQNGFYGPGGSAPKPKPKPKTTITTPTGGGGSKGGGGGGAAPRESELPQLQRNLELSDKLLAVDRARLEAQLQGNTEEIKRLSNLRVAFELEGKIADITAEKIPEQEKQAKVLLAQNEAARAALDILYEDKELQKQKAEALEGTLRPIQDEITLLQAKLNGNEEEIKQLIEIRDLKNQIKENGGDPSQAAALVKQRDELAKQAEAADKLKAQYKSLAESIASSLTGAFRSVIDGSKSAEQALSDAFSGIADAFLDMAMKMIQEWLVMQALGIVTGLLGGGPSAAGGINSFGGGNPLGALTGSMPFTGLATGGTAEGGEPYIVGEKGPELFIPGVTGTVTNNDQFEAARDAMSGSSSGSSSAFSENADAIAVSSSYARERTLERERSESITSAGSMVIETQVINSTEYATVDQLRQSNAATAKQARAQVFSDMKNRPAIRRQVGVK